MVIRLSQASADVLSHIDDIKKWRVQPTMTRGAKAMSSKRAPFKLNLPKSKAKAKPKQKGKGKKKASHDEVLAPEDFKCQDFTRNEQGHITIRACVSDLYSVDQKIFPTIPLFNAEKKCRMKFEGAMNHTWPEILDIVPYAFEHMCFDRKILSGRVLQT